MIRIRWVSLYFTMACFDSRGGYSARRSARCIVNAENALMTANMINPLCACRSKSATAHSETNTNVRPNTVLR